MTNTLIYLIWEIYADFENPGLSNQKVIAVETTEENAKAMGQHYLLMFRQRTTTPEAYQITFLIKEYIAGHDYSNQDFGEELQPRKVWIEDVWPEKNQSKIQEQDPSSDQSPSGPEKDSCSNAPNATT